MVKAVVIGGRFALNLSHPVGPQCPNQADDVQLVKFGYFCKGSNPAGFAKDPSAQPIWLKVAENNGLSAHYTGGVNEPLTTAIWYHQNLINGIKDGKVSPFRDNNTQYSDGRVYRDYVLGELIANMCDLYKQLWPRIDLIPGCPSFLAISIRNLIPNNS
jgi:hypothetical protein